MNTVETVEDFNNTISKDLVLVDFYADWCGPCKMMESKLNQLDGESDFIKIIKVDIESLVDVVKEYNVQSIPTLVLISEGEEVERFVGTTSVKDLKNVISEYKS